MLMIHSFQMPLAQGTRETHLPPPFKPAIRSHYCRWREGVTLSEAVEPDGGGCDRESEYDPLVHGDQPGEEEQLQTVPLLQPPSYQTVGIQLTVYRVWEFECPPGEPSVSVSELAVDHDGLLVRLDVPIHQLSFKLRFEQDGPGDEGQLAAEGHHGVLVPERLGGYDLEDVVLPVAVLLPVDLLDAPHCDPVLPGPLLPRIARQLERPRPGRQPVEYAVNGQVDEEQQRVPVGGLDLLPEGHLPVDLPAEPRRSVLGILPHDISQASMEAMRGDTTNRVRGK
mmetsp:Transcript_16671/g.47484  ORF Transcript_16671/g.47484 Transcript_16671/m.47484 type:complete len:282 (+) Transcript_16671:1358-2203(+)